MDYATTLAGSCTGYAMNTRLGGFLKDNIDGIAFHKNPSTPHSVNGNYYFEIDSVANQFLSFARAILRGKEIWCKMDCGTPHLHPKLSAKPNEAAEKPKTRVCSSLCVTLFFPITNIAPSNTARRVYRVVAYLLFIPATAVGLILKRVALSSNEVQARYEYFRQIDTTAMFWYKIFDIASINRQDQYKELGSRFSELSYRGSCAGDLYVMKSFVAYLSASRVYMGKIERSRTLMDVILSKYYFRDSNTTREFEFIKEYLLEYLLNHANENNFVNFGSRMSTLVQCLEWERDKPKVDDALIKEYFSAGIDSPSNEHGNTHFFAITVLRRHGFDENFSRLR